MGKEVRWLCSTTKLKTATTSEAADHRGTSDGSARNGFIREEATNRAKPTHTQLCRGDQFAIWNLGNFKLKKFAVTATSVLAVRWESCTTKMFGF